MLIINKLSTNCLPTAEAALPTLTEASQDDEPVVRVLAAVAVGKIRGSPSFAVPELVKELNDDNSADHQSVWTFQATKSRTVGGFAFKHRQTAAWFLGEIGPAAREALPSLKKALTARGTSLPVLAARAIWKIDRQTEAVVPTLLDALSSKEESQCMLAASFLGEMGPPAKPALPALIQARKVSLAVRREANDALRKIDPETAEQVRHK